MPEPLLQLTTHPATASTLVVAGLRLAVLDAAPPAGPGARGTALLLPGYTGSKEDFAPVLGPLAERGWRVVAVDQPGQHESTGPDDPGAYAVVQLGDVAVQLAGRLGGPVHLLGHSVGGLVARAAVLARPAAWRSLVLMDSGPAAISGARRQRLDALEPLLSSGGVEAVYEAGEELARADPAYVAPSPAQRDFLRRRFFATSAASLQGMGDGLRSEPDRTRELRATGTPTLVCYGAADDAWSPAQQQEMADRLGAQSVVIPDAIHSPAVQNPSATVEALDAFWSAHT